MPEIDVYIVLAQAINFGILMLLFHIFVSKKLSKKIEERKIHLEKLATADIHYEKKISLAKQEKEEMLLRARETSHNLMKESESIAKHKSNEIIRVAHAKAISILEGWKRDVDKERRSMLAEMKKHILDVSLKLNEKMFGSSNINKEFIEQEFKNIK